MAYQGEQDYITELETKENGLRDDLEWQAERYNRDMGRRLSLIHISSKGVIAEEFPYTEIARAYEAAGADCVSVLTEPKWFFGSDDIFREIRATISIPMIRKDFTVDPYQIYEAKLMGADAVLLICAPVSYTHLR